MKEALQILNELANIISNGNKHGYEVFAMYGVYYVELPFTGISLQDMKDISDSDKFEKVTSIDKHPTNNRTCLCIRTKIPSNQK